MNCEILKQGKIRSISSLLTFTVYGSETNTYYALKDHLNSVMAFADESGQIVESYEYDAWGNITVYDENGDELTSDSGLPTSGIGNRFTFQGREISWETGLYNFRARWYDAITGRWLSKDPIGISGGLNQYVFCVNNPVNRRDPMGLDPEEPSSLYDSLNPGSTFGWPNDAIVVVPPPHPVMSVPEPAIIQDISTDPNQNIHPEIFNPFHWDLGHSLFRPW